MAAASKSTHAKAMMMITLFTDNFFGLNAAKTTLLARNKSPELTIDSNLVSCFRRDDSELRLRAIVLLPHVCQTFFTRFERHPFRFLVAVFVDREQAFLDCAYARTP